MQLSSHILFITLKVFSSTGGIEKVCRVIGKAFYEFGLRRNADVKIFSMYDSQQDADDNKYFPTENFRGYGVRKTKFIVDSVRKGQRCNVVVLSHVNLLLAGWLIKKIRPQVKLILITHGIEIWGRQKRVRRMMLQCCDEIVSVSTYTRRKLIEENDIPPAKCSVMNNCLDPFLILPRNVVVPPDLAPRYGIKQGDKILFTLSRLSAKERYKGYDKVMEAMTMLPDNVKYIIAGSYDNEEKDFINGLIKKFNLRDRVVLAGFINDEDVEAHFAMSDCYVMPSVKEGFGIVFIEAMFYNLPVIAGNADGSTDALRNGELGILVDPNNVDAIYRSIVDVLANPEKYRASKRLLLHYFSYASYKMQVNNLLLKYAGLKDTRLEEYIRREYLHAI